MTDDDTLVGDQPCHSLYIWPPVGSPTGRHNWPYTGNSSWPLTGTLTQALPDIVIAADGALHMRAAVTAARAGRTMSAGDHLAEARRFARRVPEGVYYGTAFGPASVHIHHVTLSVDLGDADAALRAALGWAPPIGLPAKRRSHYYVDLARAQLQAGRQHQALASLIAARAIAPEHIHEHPDVRGALSSLLHTVWLSQVRCSISPAG